MTASIDTDLQSLGRKQPEWEPWLAVVRELLSEAADAKWEAVVLDRAEASDSKVPLLAGAVIAMDLNRLRRWTERLFATAGRSGTKKMATLKGALRGTADTLALFKASLRQDEGALKQIALVSDADPDAFQAVAALLPIPFLRACNRRWSRPVPRSWAEGYCPVCGAWPALAETRGIERSRYFRCGRCAGEWQVNCLVCAYCGMSDHEQLVSLVPEQGGAMRVIEACKRCLGYVKSFTTLQAIPPAKLILDDLASVDLDVAALEHGYKRPRGLGYACDVTISEQPAEQFSLWRA
jgi:FdhE protein